MQLSLLLLLLVANIVSSQPIESDDFCIRGLCLFDPLSRAYELFGQPLKLDTIETELDTMYVAHLDGLTVTTGSFGLITRIQIKSTMYRTHRGITIGDSLHTVRSRYGGGQSNADASELRFDSGPVFLSVSFLSHRVILITIGEFERRDP